MNSPVNSWREIKKLHNFLNKKGRLLSWTQIHAAPNGFDDYAPYFSGIVEFEDELPHSFAAGYPTESSSMNKTRLPVQIVDCEEKDLKIGTKVITVVRRGVKVKEDEIIEYIIKVKPIK